MADWYTVALDKLIDDLKSNEKVSGLDFLEDFVLENREQYFEDLEFDDVDRFVSNQFEDFQDWLTKQTEVKVLPNGKWVKQTLAVGSTHSVFTSSLETAEEMLLNDEDIKLLELQIYEITPSNFEDFQALYAKLSGANLAEYKYKCALRLAKCGEIKTEVLDYQLIKLWVNAFDAASEAGFKDKACDSLSEAAYHCLRISKYKDAAQHFEKAAEILDDNKFDLKSQLLKNARTQYQAVGDHDSATKVFLEEKNLERRSASRPVKLALFLYRFTSNYGESPSRVAINVIFVLAFSVLFFYVTLVSEDLSTAFFEKLVDCFYYSVVTFTTLGYGDITPENISGKIFSGFLAFLGLVYTSLFMVTVVRKYARA